MASTKPDGACLSEARPRTRDPLIVEVPTVLSRIEVQLARQNWESLSERDRRFLQTVIDGEDEWGPGSYGVVARDGGDSSTIRSLVRRGFLEAMGYVRDTDAECGRDIPGFTLTERGRSAMRWAAERHGEEKT